MRKIGLFAILLAILTPRGTLQAEKRVTTGGISSQHDSQEEDQPLPSIPFKIPNNGGEGGGQMITPNAAGATTCPSGSQFVQVCIDSAMDRNASGYVPPDPHGAVGMNSLIAVTNKLIEGLRKSNGTTIFGPTDLSTMFASLTPQKLFDPKIRYDLQRDRFVVVVLDIAEASSTVTGSSIMVAVSKSGDPTSASTNDWYLLKIPALTDGAWADYPGLAVDEEAIYITCNMYVNDKVGGVGYRNGLLWIVAKDPFYTGGTPVWKVHDYSAQMGVGSSFNTHIPAMVRSTTGIAPNVGTYLVAYGGVINSTMVIEIVQVDSPLGANTTFQQAYIPIGIVVDSISKIPDAPQPGTSVLIDSGDRRALDAVWVNNALWMVKTIEKDNNTQRAAAWVKFTANGVNFPPTFADVGVINGGENIETGTFTYYPSIDVNSRGVVAIGFSASSNGTIYGSAYATMRDDTKDIKGTVRKPDLVKKGVSTYVAKDSSGRNRWGDFTSTALDPSNDNCFWVFNEYVGATNKWSTAWAKLCYNSSSTGGTTNPPTRVPTRPPTPTNSTRPPTRNPTRQPTRRHTMRPTKKPTKPTKLCLSRRDSCKPQTAPYCCSPWVCRKVKDGLVSFKYKCAHCVNIGLSCERSRDCCSGSTCNQKTKLCE